MKKNIAFGLLSGFLMVFILHFLQSCQTTGPKAQDPVLWYKSPAKIWEDALPIGNGRLGAIVFGNPTRERIQLNDDSLWPAEMGWDEPDGTPEDMKMIRSLVLEGNVQKADELIVEKFSRKDILKSHQTLGELYIDLEHYDIADYRRQLNLATAITDVSFRSNGYLVTQQAFASHPHQVIAVRYTTESPEGLTGRIRLDRPKDRGIPTINVSATAHNKLLMKGEVTQMGGIFDSKPFPVTEGVKFETLLKTSHEGGEINAVENYLELAGVKTLTIFLVSNSSYYTNNISTANEAEMAKLEEVSYEKIREDHIHDHQQLFSRVNFQIGDFVKDTIPTDTRIDNARNGNDDSRLTELLFHYGRYLLIASSRPGTNPANLQGLWNEHIEAPWNADYHLNINLQMNYWLADITNLSELNKPLFDYIDKLVESGKTTAQKNFGCRGSFFPHACDLWAASWLQARTAFWGSSFGAGGWMMQHYWQHFEFSLDTSFLKERVFPALHEVALFYSDWITEDPRDGKLVSGPSTSPENQYIAPNGKPAALCMGPAFDQQIIAEVFDNYINTCRILNLSNELLDTIIGQRGQLRDGFVLGSDGRILEWDREYEEYEPGHRHMSHLYGFHPGVSVTMTSNPRLFDAVRKTLDYRLDHGGAGTGWSRAWLINCAARLLDGKMAHEQVRYFISQSVYNNLFDAHPPFQIDGNFGFTAGIAEMLLQSHEPEILRILPALPPSWEKGNITGLKARGGYTVDIEWENGKASNITIHARLPGKLTLMINNEEVLADLEQGEVFKFRR